MLTANAIGCWRDQRELFSDLTFNLGPGSVVRVSGINGAGKSSLLKILAGILPPCVGTVRWCGHAASGDPEFLSHLLYIGHKIGIQSALTPFENLQWLISITSPCSYVSEDLMAALHAVGLGNYAHTPCEALSKGQCQRVALARLWIYPASCWILDEPATALDDSGMSLLQNRLLAHLEEGGSVVLASHAFFELMPFKPLEIQLGVGGDRVC